MKRSFVVTALALTLSVLVSFSARADKPQKPPVGMGKYIMFLKTAPAVPAGQTPKKIVPPDVAKQGGVVLQKKDGYQIIYLPFPALKALRKDENVDYVQRVWMGETADEWRTTEAIGANSSIMRLKTDTLTETASWGPKNYSYDGSGHVKQIAEYDANGNVKTDGTDKYRYDGASRLKEAVVNGITETYTYDSFGNLSQKQTGNATSVLNIDSTSNRVSNYTYDIAGHVTRDSRRTYDYDALGMLIGVSGYPKRMFYDADEERVGFTLGSSGDFSRWIITDFDGRPLREFRSDYPLSYLQDAEWLWTEDWVYAGGQLVGGETAGPWGTYEPTVASDRRRRHYHLDYLGSVRLITTDTGAVALGVHNYYPYGTEQSMFYQEEYNFGGTGGIRPEPMRFTGQYRDFNGYWNVDNTDYLDYLHARFYDPQQERFLSADPAPDSVLLQLPQSWNRYAYALDNPVNIADPTGKYPCRVKLTGDDAKAAKVDDGTVVDAECVEATAPPKAEDVVMDWLKKHEHGLQAFGNLSAGFADVVTLTLTKRIRKAHGQDQFIDKCSGLYLGGEIAGTVWWTGISGGMGSSAAAAGSAEGAAATELGQITLTDAEFAEKGLAGLSNAQKLKALGGNSGAVGKAVLNVFKPGWWKAVAQTTATTGPTLGSGMGTIGLAGGSTTAAANTVENDCF